MIQERFQTKISRRYGIDLYPAYIFAGDLSRAARFYLLDRRHHLILHIGVRVDGLEAVFRQRLVVESDLDRSARCEHADASRAGHYSGGRRRGHGAGSIR